jgi:RNA polymerase sigma-70 factor, ECF subfamily
MFWKIKSTLRAALTSTPITAPLRRFSRSGWRLGDLELAGLPAFSSRIGAAGLGSAKTPASRPTVQGEPGFSPALRLARTGRPDREPGSDPDEGLERPSKDHSGDGNSGRETGYGAQPSTRDGVPEDMATMVLDSPALVTGSAAGSTLRSDPAQEAGLRGELDPASDAAVMLRVAAGDESSFNYLVGKYHRPMIHFLYRMVHNQSVAEELAQEVFLRVYRARDSYRAEARFTTWLYRIATNLAVNHARDTRHERAAQTVYLDAPDEETGTTPDLADDEPSVEQRLLRDERMAAIRSHVMALPERQRMAVLMHKYQGMDYRQIGEVLKLSESATKSLLFRAYQTLREKLKDFV